jgi:hypothetical protein
MNARLRRAAREELASIIAYCKRTGEDPRNMIKIPDNIKATLEAFIEANPEAAEEIEEAMDTRDYMLSRYERRQRMADSGIDTWEDYRGEK